MAKSDSTRNPPSKVWLVFDSESRLIDWANHRLGIAKSDEQAHQYAPLQKPRRCVWEARPGATLGDHKTKCGWWMTRDERFGFCPYCGGKIVRRKS